MEGSSRKLVGESQVNRQEEAQEEARENFNSESDAVFENERQVDEGLLTSDAMEENNPDNEVGVNKESKRRPTRDFRSVMRRPLSIAVEYFSYEEAKAFLAENDIVRVKQYRAFQLLHSNLPKHPCLFMQINGLVGIRFLERLSHTKHWKSFRQ